MIYDCEKKIKINKQIKIYNRETDGISAFEIAKNVRKYTQKEN